MDKRKLLRCGAVVAMGALSTVAVLLVSKSNAPDIVSGANPVKQSVLLDSGNKKLPFWVCKINPMRDTVLYMASGTCIRIPSQSFCDAKGVSVKQTVELKYREFHNMAQTLVAGIPMQYDSAGTGYHFESAGMFELRASCNTTPVSVSAGKNLTVDLVSLNAEQTAFRQYFMNDINGKWEYVGKDVVSIRNAGSNATPTLLNQSALPGRSTAMPPKPKLANPSSQQFLVEVPPGIFPELDIFNGVVFEPERYPQEGLTAMASKAWQSVTIENAASPGEYKLVFRRTGEAFTINAFPVFDSVNYVAAMHKYRKLNQALAKRIGQNDTVSKNNAVAFENLADASDKYRELVKQNYRFFYDSLQAAETRLNLTGQNKEVVFRTFQVNKFGFWNSDCPQNLPQGAIVNTKFISATDGSALAPAVIYLVEKGKNAVYTFSPGQKISLNPASSNAILVVTTAGALAWIQGSDFPAIASGESQQTFRLRLLNKQGLNMADVNRILTL